MRTTIVSSELGPERYRHIVQEDDHAVCAPEQTWLLPCCATTTPHLKQQLECYSNIYGDNYVCTITYLKVSGQFTSVDRKLKMVLLVNYHSVEFHCSIASAHKLLGIAFC